MVSALTNIKKMAVCFKYHDEIISGICYLEIRNNIARD